VLDATDDDACADPCVVCLRAAITLGVPAMRMGNLKAHFITMGSQSCYNASHMPRTGKARSIVHDPPLVFDISRDPGENHPIDPSTITVRQRPIKLTCHDRLRAVPHLYPR